MDPATASYFRAALFGDSQAQEKIPQSLMELYLWVQKRHEAAGLGTHITKAMAITTVMTWFAATREGRQFAIEHTKLGSLFIELVDEEKEASKVDWSTIAKDVPVIVTYNDGTNAPGQFLEHRGSWIDVRVDGKEKAFRASKVQLAQ